jgi:anti-sigma factor (TIGR02949 family)
MKPCDNHKNNIQRYLDNELSDGESENLFAHLSSCADCRAQLEEEQALSRVLRQSRPLYTSPAELRARVSNLLIRGSEPNTAAQRLHQRVEQVLRHFRFEVLRWVPRWRVLAPAMLTIAICLMLASHVTRGVRAASYVDAAVSTHRSYLGGDLALGIHSDSPKMVTTWLADRLPFAFQLPNSQADPDSPAYRLTGAGLVSYKGCQAAVVTYEGARNGKISLLVASDKYAVVAGGDEVHSAGLTFHYRSQAGFKVITWSNHGLSYALVSGISGSARESCLVCHQSMPDKDSFRSGH